MLFNLNKNKEAIECFDAALALQPRNVFALYFKGKALFEMKCVNDAVDCCEKAYSLDRGAPLIVAGKAVALAVKGAGEGLSRFYRK